MPIDRKRLPIPDTSIDPASFVSDEEYPGHSKATSKAEKSDNHDKIRPLFVKAGVISQAKGSAYIEAGNTKIICAVYGPREVTRRDEWSMQGQLMCELKYATFSRCRRQGHQADNEEKDLSSLLEQALSPAVCLDKFPKARMDVFVTVLEDDGSSLAHALTVASVALADAGINMYDIVIGCALKQKGDSLILDPTNTEESNKKDSDKSDSGCLTVGFLPSLYQICAFHQTGVISVEALSKASRKCIDTCLKIYPVVQRSLFESLKTQQQIT